MGNFKQPPSPHQKFTSPAAGPGGGTGLSVPLEPEDRTEKRQLKKVYQDQKVRCSDRNQQEFRASSEFH